MCESEKRRKERREKKLKRRKKRKITILTNTVGLRNCVVIVDLLIITIYTKLDVLNVRGFLVLTSYFDRT